MDASTPTIVLHHLVDSRSERIFWALEELGLSYEVVVHQRSRFGGATKSLGQATESGKAPSLQLDGEWLSESAYILHRLLAYTLQRQNGQSATHQHPAVQLHASTKTSATGLSPAQASLTPHTEASPAGIGASTSSPATSSSPSSSDAQVSCPMRTPDSINVELVPSNPSIHFAHWAEGSLMLWMQAFLLHRLTTNQFISGRLPIGGKTVDEGMVQGMQEWSKWAGGVIYKPGTQRNIDAMESFIKDHAYFSGTNQPGIGDFMLAYPMSTLILENDQGKKGPYEIGEGLKKWMARVRARPAYQKAQKRLKAEEDAQRPAAQAKL